MAIFYCFHLSFPIVQLLGKCYIFPCVGLKQNPLKSRVLENRKMSTGYEDFKEIAPIIPMQQQKQSKIHAYLTLLELFTNRLPTCPDSAAVSMIQQQVSRSAGVWVGGVDGMCW